MRSLLLFVALSIGATLCAQFSPPQTIHPADLGDPWKLGAADLDGDGLQDIVVQTFGTPKLGWCRNSGNGEWEPASVISSTFPYYGQWLLADLDLDGDTDVVACGSLALAALGTMLNAGDGTFLPFDSLPQPDGNITTIDLSDIDQDGDLDLLYNSYFTRWLGWCENDGAGGFSFVGHIDSLLVTALTSADVDGDGDEDLLVNHSDSLDLYESLGGGTYAAPITLATGEYPGRIYAVDIDLDNDLDVVTTRSTGSWGFVCYENLGTGLTFSAPHILAPDVFSAIRLTFSDLDGDGDIDALPHGSISGGGVVWIRNDGGWNWTGVLIGQVTGITDVVGADIDNDGDLDPFVVGETAGTREAVQVFRNTPPGTFTFDRYLPALPDVISVAIGDMNGDGHVDVLTSSQLDARIAWYPNSGSGSFEPQRTLGVQLLSPNARLTDLDGDGDLDLVASSGSGLYWAANDGMGSFTDPVQLATTSTTIRDLICTDLNGDALPDLACACWAGTTYAVSVLLNLGSGSFSAPIDHTSVNKPNFIVAGDLDGDLDPDLLINSSGEGLLKWRSNDGNGGFGGAINTATSISNVTRIRNADLDLDGDVDILIASNAGAHWCSNNGAGAFSSPASIAASTYLVDIESSDVDGDGDMDLVTFGSAPRIAWSENDGSSSTFFPHPIDPSTGPTKMGFLADLDNDGDLDIGNARTSDVILNWVENFIGSPFRIHGQAFLDNDGSGSYTTNDAAPPFLPILTTPVASMSLTTMNGNYTIHADTGAYSVFPVLPSGLWGSGPVAQSVQLTNNTPESFGNDFAITSLVDTVIVVPTLVMAEAPCGDTTTLWVSIANQGTLAAQGSIYLLLDSQLVLVSSDPPPASISGDTLTWPYDSLNCFGIRTITLLIQLPGVGQIGDTLRTIVSLTCEDSLGMVFDTDVGELTRVHSCAYDPNDKQVVPTGQGLQGIIPLSTEYLDYTIRFQNTGSDTAYDVFIRDQFHELLEPATVQVLGYSHQPSSILFEEDATLKFRFDGIMLPDSTVDEPGSQGFISFRVGVVAAAPNYSCIENQAEIYFDLNPAVITNTTVSTLVDCAQFTAEIFWAGPDTLRASPADVHQWYLNGSAIPGATDELLITLSPGTYTVEASNSFGCSALSTGYPVISTGLPRIASGHLTVFPNPFMDAFSITSDEAITPQHEVRLIDAVGREVRQLKGQGSTTVVLSREGLAPGLYVVQVVLHGTVVSSSRVMAE